MPEHITKESENHGTADPKAHLIKPFHRGVSVLAYEHTFRGRTRDRPEIP